MRPRLLTAGIIGCLAVAVASPSLAQPGAVYYAPVPVYVPWYAGPSYEPVVPHYQGPDGRYDSLADFTRDLRGIPCGIECTYRAQVRWGVVPPRPYYPH
jgi:hypothetical protein